MKTLKRCILGLVFIAFVGVLFLMTRRAHIPPPNPEDLWICNEFDISFVGFDEEKGGPAGQVTVNGEVIEVAICIGPGPQFRICPYPQDAFNDVLIRGNCYFSEDKGRVHIKEDKAGILCGAETITFSRQKQTSQDRPANKSQAQNERKFSSKKGMRNRLSISAAIGAGTIGKELLIQRIQMSFHSGVVDA